MFKHLLDSSSWLALAAMAPPDKPGAAGGKPTTLNEDVGSEDDGATSTSGEDDGAEGSIEGGTDDQDAAGSEDEPMPPVAKTFTEKDVGWRDKQLAKQHRRLKEEQAERARLTQELADANALLARQPKGESEAPPAAKSGATELPQDQVQAAARQIVAQETYVTQCNEAFKAGKKAYPDKWDSALDQLGKMGGLGEDQAGVEVMQAILATDDPAKVLFELGSNPETYDRVMELPPARRMAELVKLGVKAVTKREPKRPSDTPAPTDGIERRANANSDGTKLYDDNTSDEDWYKIRSAQKARRFDEKLKRGAA